MENLMLAENVKEDRSPPKEEEECPCCHVCEQRFIYWLNQGKGKTWTNYCCCEEFVNKWKNTLESKGYKVSQSKSVLKISAE